MIQYKKAIIKLKKNKLNIKNELILVEESLNRISASDLKSPNNYPSADNSAFDGYAVVSSETKNLKKNNPKKFRIIKTLAAGDNPNLSKLNKFSTIEIMTGAIIKKPFDTIIPIENIKFYPDKKKSKIYINK